MNIFVTGGTGNIGSHVVLELVNRGHAVTVLARNPGKIQRFQHNEHIRLVCGTLEDYELIESSMQGMQAVVHIALNYSEDRKWQTALDDTLPTIRLAEIASKAGVGHFVYTSSTSVNDTLYSLENRDPDETIVLGPHSAHSIGSFYGATKAACEAYLSAFAYQTAMRVNVIRPGYTFGNPIEKGGPIQGDTRFADLVKRAKRNERIELDKGDGTQFISSRDIARLYADLMESELNHKVYYALAKQFVTWAEIAKVIIEKTGSSSELRVTDSGRKGGLFWDVSAMKKDFGLEFDPWPELIVHVEETIRRIEEEE